ncbi:MAG: helix-turn-helix transcriptional regulator [Pseudomonadota bacterium]
MDRRDVSDTFRARLAQLLARSGQRQAPFAARIGIDRSALSQLLTGAGARLPRADTLVAIARAHQVSVDWLLGLSEDEGVVSATRGALEIASGAAGAGDTLLAQWHEEARGAKIRYVPATLPDLLRTDKVTEFEYADAPAEDASQRQYGDFRRDYIQLPETDMECAMPRQTLELFAAGKGVWSGLSRADRSAQLGQMARITRENYPGFRLYLFDGRERFSMPYTIFGHGRVAVYAGEIYLLLNARATILTMVAHFDALIRGAEVHAHAAADFIEGLEVG